MLLNSTKYMCTYVPIMGTYKRDLLFLFLPNFINTNICIFYNLYQLLFIKIRNNILTRFEKRNTLIPNENFQNKWVHYTDIFLLFSNCIINISLIIN